MARQKQQIWWALRKKGTKDGFAVQSEENHAPYLFASAGDARAARWQWGHGEKDDETGKVLKFEPVRVRVELVK